MSNRTLFQCASILLAGMCILFFINFLPMLFPGIAAKYIDPKTVESMAVFHKDLPYTLNFSQQNEFLDVINHAADVKSVQTKKSHLDIEKIVIYRFDQPAIELTLSGSNLIGNLVWQVKEWNPDGYIVENSNGKLTQLLSNSYDHD